ncbi:MAG: methylmalonyl-CoA epimerase [Planctomycetota bacterium]|nr:methylmalonyl-CoA epimerase [Planctomycetota bacterium]
MIHAKAVNHIGIAVRSLEANRTFYESVLGARFAGIETVADQRVRVAFFELGPPGHEVRLELLEPTSPDSPIAGFIEKRGEGLHHVAYTVDDIRQRLADLAASSISLIDKTPRPGAHHTQIAFLHPRSSMGVLTELCQPAHDNLSEPTS